MHALTLGVEKCNKCQEAWFRHIHLLVSAHGNTVKSPPILATDWALQIVRYMLSPGSLSARGVIGFDLVGSLTITPAQAQTLKIAVGDCHLPAFFGSFNEAAFFRAFGESLKALRPPTSPLPEGYPYVVNGAQGGG